MRKMLLLWLCLLAGASAARANVLRLCMDPASCDLIAPAGFYELYLIERYNNGGVSACRFTLDASTAPGTELLSFTSDYSFTGSVNTEIAVNFGSCTQEDVVVGRLFAVVACGYIGILNPFTYDCLQHIERSIYSNTFCVCARYPGSQCFELPTEPSTWGGVKALYR
jgi:hypothetical protein